MQSSPWPTVFKPLFNENQLVVSVPPEDSVFIDYVTKRKVTQEDGSVQEVSVRKVVAIPFEEAENTGPAVQRMRKEELYNVEELYPGEENKEIRRKAKADVLASFVVVKGDKEVNYGIMEKLFNSLREESLNSFQVITELETE